MSVINVKIKHKGFYSEDYLHKLQNSITLEKLKKLAEESLVDFINASPSKEIANNWGYNIKINNKKYVLDFENSFIENGYNIAVIVDVGHGTPSGKWVSGLNYLKEPIKKTYERIDKLLLEAL